jgi:cytoskeletal protein CcmA (bactofilin family)
MGLFGRDERSDVSKPAPAEPQARPSAVSTSGASVTLIAKPIRVEGRIEGSGEVRIEGAFKGELNCAAQLVVAQGGDVEAELRADLITISGRVRGDIFAGKKIELTPSANVQGDITSPRILIREGATFEGQVCMSEPDSRTTAKPTGKAAESSAPGKKPEPKPNSKPQPKDEPKADSKPDSEPDSKSESEDEPKPDSKPDLKPGSKSDSK